MGKKVISFGLWGDDPRYVRGAEANVVLAREHYPGWECWFWVDQTVPHNVVRLLENQPDCRVIMEDSADYEMPRLFRRFLSIEFAEVEIVIVRDADSRLSKREKLAVVHWLDSSNKFHVMRDCPFHKAKMLGGMWGCRAASLRNIRELIVEYLQNHRNYKPRTGIDQDFLDAEIWPSASSSCTVHDPYFSNQPFPDNSLDIENFIGRIYSAWNADWEIHTPRLGNIQNSTSTIPTTTPDSKAGDRLLILYYNGMYGGPPEVDKYEVEGVEFSVDRNRFAEADVVVFHTPNMVFKPGFVPEKGFGQVWVSWSLESEVNYPIINDPRFEVKMTYQREADIWIPYFTNNYPNYLEALKNTPDESNKDNYFASFISSPFNQSGRLEYLLKLSEFIDIHHYGRFMKNTELANDQGRKSKKEVIDRYKFVIAFENSCCPDYVTEKFFDAFVSRSVPVYLGAPNVDEYAPGDHCYINVRDYASPEELAEHLTLLVQDDTMYQQYFAWQKQPLRTAFVKMVQSQTDMPPTYRRLAEYAKQRYADKTAIQPVLKENWKLKKSWNKLRLVNSADGSKINMNRESALVWQLCSESKHIGQIFDFLSQAYPKHATRIQKDTWETLQQLYQLGVIDSVWPAEKPGC